MPTNFLDGSANPTTVMAAGDRTAATSMPASNTGDELELPLPVLMGSVSVGTMWKADSNGNPIAAVAGTDYVVPGGALGTPSSGVGTNLTGLNATNISSGTLNAARLPATAALTGGSLAQFAATTSAQLAGVISDETGSGALVFATSPTLITPILGTPGSGNLTNCSGYPAQIPADTGWTANADAGDKTAIIPSQASIATIAGLLGGFSGLGALLIALSSKVKALETALATPNRPNA